MPGFLIHSPVLFLALRGFLGPFERSRRRVGVAWGGRMSVIAYLLTLGRSAQRSLSPCQRTSCRYSSPPWKPSSPHPPGLTGVQKLLLSGTCRRLLITSHTALCNFLWARRGGAVAGKEPTGNARGAARDGCPSAAEILSPASNVPARKRQVPQERFFCLFSSGLTSNQRI